MDNPTVLDEDVILAARELKDVRAMQSQLKAREEKLREKILTALDGAELGMTGSGAKVVHTVPMHRRQVNSGKLEALFPAVFAEVIEEKTSYMLKIDLD